MASSRTVTWLVAAVADVEEIVEVIARDSATAAERFAKAILDRASQLSHSPYLGAVCPHARRARQLIHGNYIIYYSVHRSEVRIRAVVHGARLFQSYWLRRKS